MQHHFVLDLQLVRLGLYFILQTLDCCALLIKFLLVFRLQRFDLVSVHQAVATRAGRKRRLLVTREGPFRLADAAAHASELVHNEVDLSTLLLIFFNPGLGSHHRLRLRLGSAS